MKIKIVNFFTRVGMVNAHSAIHNGGYNERQSLVSGVIAIIDNGIVPSQSHETGIGKLGFVHPLQERP